jgi:hypothetical protein
MASARFLTIFDFARYRCSLVAIICPCGHVRHLPPAHLAELFGWPAWIKQVERRLVCSGCGRRGPRLRPVA